MFIYALYDIECIIGVVLVTDPEITKYLFSLVMFVCALCGIEYIPREVIGTDPGDTKYHFGIAMFVGVLHGIEYPPPLYYFLHNTHYIYYIIPSVHLIDPENLAVAVLLSFNVQLYKSSADFPLLHSVDTHNIPSRAAYYSV